MEPKKALLLDAVKTAAVKYGLEGMTTRNIAEVAGISDAHLYRFFRSKEELLLEAYKRDNAAIIGEMVKWIDSLKGVPLQFQSKAHFLFHQSWRLLLEDKDRLAFCVYYFHSPSFSQAAEFHQEQLGQLMQRLTKYFPDEDSCKRTLYSLMTHIYDAGKRVVDGITEDTPENEEKEFKTFYKLLTVFIPDAPAEA